MNNTPAGLMNDIPAIPTNNSTPAIVIIAVIAAIVFVIITM